MQYEDRKPKYIIYDDEFRWGRVPFHRDLIGSNEDEKLIRGGGWFHIGRETKKIYFFASSFDFGPLTKEQFDSADKWRLVRQEEFELIFLGPEFPKLEYVADHFNCTIEEL